MWRKIFQCDLVTPGDILWIHDVMKRIHRDAWRSPFESMKWSRCGSGWTWARYGNNNPTATIFTFFLQAKLITAAIIISICINYRITPVDCILFVGSCEEMVVRSMWKRSIHRYNNISILIMIVVQYLLVSTTHCILGIRKHLWFYFQWKWQVPAGFFLFGETSWTAGLVYHR